MGALADDPGIVREAFLNSDFDSGNSSKDRSTLIGLLLQEKFSVSSRTILRAISGIRHESRICWPAVVTVLSRWLLVEVSHDSTDVFLALKRVLDTNEMICKDRRDAALTILQRGPYGEHGNHRCSQTPLQQAAWAQAFDVVQALVSAGADVNAFEPEVDCEASETHPGCGLIETRTALQHAVSNNDKIMTPYLLSHGADVNAAGSDLYESTALKIAVANSNIELVQLLVDAGADVNLLSSVEYDRTALQHAAGIGNMEIAKLVLVHGAKVNGSESEKYGRTALQAAAETGNSDMARMLLAEGADVNWPPAPSGGVTALQAAAIGGHLDVCQILIAVGADVDADASRLEGRTAIEGAAEHGRLDVLKWLLDLWVERSVGQGAEDDLAFRHTIQSAKQYADANCRRSIVEFLDDYQREAASRHRASRGLLAEKNTDFDGDDEMRNLEQGPAGTPQSSGAPSTTGDAPCQGRAWSPDLAPWLRSPAPSECLWDEERCRLTLQIVISAYPMLLIKHC